MPHQEVHRYFEAIVESSDDAILSKDLNGIIRSWNPAAQKIFGYTASEVIGKPVTILIPEGHLNEEPDILARLRRGEKIDHYQTLRKRKDGSLVNISLTVSPIKNAEGKVIGASKIARDVTEQKPTETAIKKAREELAQLNAELETRVEQRTESLHQAIAQMEEFSYSVSHDLRSPVRAMQAYAKVIIEDFGSGLDTRVLDYLNRIIRGSMRMDKLILDLLVYSKMARQTMELGRVEISDLIRDIIHHYPEMQPPQAHIEIQGRLPAVLAHEPSLTQVFSNLLSNAVKFVAPGVVPRVNIREEHIGKNVAILIEDNGIGISAEFRARLFGLFERGKQNLQYSGTGIGLAIVRKAIERMGGQVEIVPEVATGSIFRIVLPGPAQEGST